jgi:hypothetical protein
LCYLANDPKTKLTILNGAFEDFLAVSETGPVAVDTRERITELERSRELVLASLTMLPQGSEESADVVKIYDGNRQTLEEFREIQSYRDTWEPGTPVPDSLKDEMEEFLSFCRPDPKAIDKSAMLKLLRLLEFRDFWQQHKDSYLTLQTKQEKEHAETARKFKEVGAKGVSTQGWNAWLGRTGRLREHMEKARFSNNEGNFRQVLRDFIESEPDATDKRTRKRILGFFGTILNALDRGETEPARLVPLLKKDRIKDCSVETLEQDCASLVTRAGFASPDRRSIPSSYGQLDSFTVLTPTVTRPKSESRNTSKNSMTAGR